MLASKRESLRRKNEALKLVVHLAGDIHQPLHAATHDDRGGNAAQVSFFGERDNPPYGTINLHAIWDVHMVRRLVLDRGGKDTIVSTGRTPRTRRPGRRVRYAGGGIAPVHRTPQRVTDKSRAHSQEWRMC
jgi:hypothetical protein